MKKILHLFLISLLVLGSYPTAGSATQPKQIDCPICGHICCCPEICAPKIKELKKKRGLLHCPVTSDRPVKMKQGCDQPVTICRFKSTDPIPAMILQERAVINLRTVIWTGAKPENATESRSPLEADFLVSPANFQEPPTPPPRRIS